MLQMSATDIKYMKRALELARKGMGTASPNPCVGAVVVKNARVIGEGWHVRPGMPHAEILALTKAGSKTKGATLYVTLEPCSTHGRTPPCVDAIREAGIKRVVVGNTDPNPKHQGRGLRKLRRSGIRVDSGVLENQAKDLIKAFSKWIVTGMPFVTLKMAVSLDGKIADAKGNSKWISCESSRNIVQGLRCEADAIMVGAGTLIKDDPSLLRQSTPANQPYRIVIGGLPQGYLKRKITTDDYRERTILILSPDKKNLKQLSTIRKRGVTVLFIPKVKNGINLKTMLRKLGEMGITNVLCEGGGKLAGSLIQADLVDEFVWFIAPVIIGGQGSRGAVEGVSWPISLAPRLKYEFAGCSGDDLVGVLTMIKK